jgi:hypothetical protein
MKGTCKTTKINMRENGWSLGSEENQALPRYKAGVLPNTTDI